MEISQHKQRMKSMEVVILRIFLLPNMADVGDKVGMLIDCEKREVVYFVNEKVQSIAFRIPNNTVFAPAVSIPADFNGTSEIRLLAYAPQ